MKVPLTYLDLELARRVRGLSIPEPQTEICPNYHAYEETFHLYSISLLPAAEIHPMFDDQTF